MNRNSRTGSRLFFIEFLIALFFFLIISTVCLRIFTKAHAITQRANALSGAQAAAASAAAIIHSGDGSAESFSTYFPQASTDENQIRLCFDRDFQILDSGDEAFYIMTVTLHAGREKTALISVSDREQTILYELSVSAHRAMTREEALQ